ncbi:MULTISPECIES: ABC transporter ATP-binding protein [Halorubrum]|uniref:ABC transporter ATP-binding protein n=1 Tax=Halorubrum ezzemoulense TaxID=337243 RepID=A0A256KNH2_HALEZ|nr:MULTISPECIES: ABC transporter ATP-binding protein [Halorubrum]OYR82243.1 ABC transporter ATP-binding protein [Halorubrum ezzemoulense]QAY21549.1 ABC transporter ATP-binding protein [Halorubrum ezzemoulense]RLM49460.1 ABC transporter ATP-binding protein [Halorubrum sp. Atlit-28R]
MSDKLLSMENVQAGYGLTQVLQGVNLDVEQGSVVSLVGRNGVGKTTTLRSVIGNISPTGGTITFDGKDITSMSTEQTIQSGIAFVPEERRIFSELTVRENIEMGRLGVDASDGPSVDQILDMFENLKERENSHGSVLSGGEQQMLAIGRALTADPDLLLLDEPTEGLAPYVVRQIEEIIRDLHDQGMTILVVEQNIPIALDVSDYTYILEKGEIVHEGIAADVREDQEVLDKHLGVGMAD